MKQALTKIKSRYLFQTDLADARTAILLNASFNSVFGQRLVKDLKPVDLENYQIQRKDQDKSDSYIDQEIGAVRGMVNKAWDNDMVTGDALKPFKKISKMLKRGSNSRDRVLSIEEFNLLIDTLPLHARNIFITGFFTGMRMPGWPPKLPHLWPPQNPPPERQRNLL